MPLEPVSQGDQHPTAHNEERVAINQLEEDLESKIPFPAGAGVGNLLRWDGVAWKPTGVRYYEGDGPPENQVAGPVGSRYIDRTGADGGAEWIKAAGGDGTTGWIVLYGDTGVRDISSLINKGNGTVHKAVVSRVQHVVDMYLDITMPTNRTETWELFTQLLGFGPGYDRGAALQDNNEKASSGGSTVKAKGGVTLFGVVGGRRDRFSGTWSTREPWPNPLPGTKAT